VLGRGIINFYGRNFVIYPKNLFHRDKTVYFIKMPDFLFGEIMAFLNKTNKFEGNF